MVIMTAAGILCCRLYQSNPCGARAGTRSVCRLLVAKAVSNHAPVTEF